MAINIRGEVESDVDAIFDVTEAAFRNHPIGNQTEQFIVSALRDAGPGRRGCPTRERPRSVIRGKRAQR